MRIEHKIINNIEHKQCYCCKNWYPLSEFRKDSSKWDNLSSYCKQCLKIKDHTIYMKDPKKKYESVLAYQRKTGLISKYKPYNPAYYSSEKSKKKKRARDLNRRALKAKADSKEKITDLIIDYILEKYNYRCAYCKTDCSKKYTIDHKLPLSREGDNAVKNLAAACKHCNSSKKNKTDIEYIGRKV